MLLGPKAGTLERDYRLLAVGLITALGAALRFYRLGAHGLWLDEAASVAFARLSWPATLRFISSSEPWMALYYVLLHFWLKLGDSEIVLRLPSVLAGIMTIPVLYALGARLFDWKTGIVAAFLLAVNPIHVEYSQAARAYTLLVLMSALSSLFFLRLMDGEPRIRTSFGYATTTALAASFHFLGILLVPIHWAALPLFGDLRRRALRLAIATGLVGLMLLPMIGLTASAASAGAASRFGWLPNSSLNNVVSFFCLFVGVLPTVAGALVAGCYALALRSAAAGFFETRPQTGRARTSWGFLMIGAVASLACAVALSFFKPMLLPRYWFAPAPVHGAGRGWCGAAADSADRQNCRAGLRARRRLADG